MRRWLADARIDAVTVALVVAFVALRLVATWDQGVAAFLDSPSYFEFGLWGAVRFPVVTAVYALVGDHRALVVLQAVLGALAWSVAAVVAGSVLAHRVAREAFRGVFLALGLSLTVTRFDNALLSESFAISLTVVLVACVLRFACRPTRASAIAVVALGAAWGLLRQNHALLLVVAAVVAGVLGAGRVHRRLAWPVAGALLLVAVLGVLLASSTTQIQEYNTAQILVRRVLTSDGDRLRWFRDHGMPDNGVVVIVPPYPDGIGDPAVALQHDRVFGPWLRDESGGTYLQYLVTHPGFVVSTAFSDDGALRGIAVGTTRYGGSDPLLPGWAEDVLWPQEGTEQTVLALVVAGILAAAAVTAVGSRSRRRALVGAGGVLLVAVANIVVVTHTAGWEYERLLVPTGVAARLALLWLLAAVVGDVSVAPASASPGPGRRRRDAPSSDPAADPAPHTAPAPVAPHSPEAVGAGPPSGAPDTP